MIKLDAIKYKARSFARRHESDTMNFNPFARVSSRTRKPDEEEGLRRSQSEGLFQSSLESDRIRNSRVERQDFGGVPHADTAPPASATSPTSPPNDWPTPQQAEGDPSDAAPAPMTSTNVPDAEKGPKKRKFFRLGKGEDEESPEPRPTTDVEKSEKPKRKITFMSQIHATILGSWINVLLLIVPVGFAVRYAHINGVAIFVVNFIAIIPLAGMLSYATEELALRVGETLGGLLNATFG